MFVTRCSDNVTNRITDIWHFKSDKSHKTYIVEVEYFSHNFYGLKFYWKGVALSRQRYSLLTNDYEPRTIVLSCIHIMLHYFDRNRCASFGFVAAPNSRKENASGANKRFRFYRRMMLSLFSENAFIQMSDEYNALYLLVNKKKFDNGEITISLIEKEIERLYEGVFEITSCHAMPQDL